MDLVTFVELVGLVIAFPVVAYAIGAVVHIYIDQRHGTKLVNKYFATTKRDIIEPLEKRIQDRMDAQTVRVNDTLAELDQRLASFKVTVPEIDVGAQLSSWMHSEDGVQWASEVAGAAADAVVASMRQQVGSAAGVVARKSQAQLTKLIRGAIDKAFLTGNPIVDGLVGMIPSDVKDRAALTLSRHLRKALAEHPAIMDAEFSVQDEDGSEPEAPALEAGGAEAPSDGYPLGG